MSLPTDKPFDLNFKPSSTIAFIISRLEFWFKVKKTEFYKFCEPCDHPLYKKGDSWVEEIGCVRISFNRCFDKIGTRYKSKTDFLNSKDIFKGKLYASYYERNSRQTFYFRNNELVNEFLHNLKKKNKPSKISRTTKQKELFLANSSFSNDDNLSLIGGTIGGKINLPTLSINTSLVSSVKKNHDEEEKIAEEMKKIWLNEINDFGDARMSASLSKHLVFAFKNLFNRCWETWKRYCRLISSSKFLMGETTNRTFKKIWIHWAIKPEIIQRIRAGEFGLGSRKTKEDEEQEIFKIDHKVLQIEKEAIENSIGIIEQKVDCDRRREINKRIDSISEQEKEALKKKFISVLEERNDPLLKDSGDKIWQNRWALMSFERFMRAEFSETLFPISFEEEVKEIVSKTNLMRFLNEVEQKINEISNPILCVEPLRI